MVFNWKVIAVGKANGLDKNRCWIKLHDELSQVKDYDFSKDVDEWHYIRLVSFEEDHPSERWVARKLTSASESPS